MKPKIHSSSYIASSAVLLGNVVIGKNCGIYPNAVIRGDENKIEIGDGSNIQDCCVIHTDVDHQVKIGKNVTIGHAAMIHGSTIEDDCLIGIHAIVLNDAVIRKGSIVGAGALVTEKMEVPENSLVLGIPGKVVRQDVQFIEVIRSNAVEYQKLSKKHKQGTFSHSDLKKEK